MHKMHSLCILKEGEEDFLTDEGGVLNFFSPLIKKGSIICGFFLLKKTILITLCLKTVC